MSPKNPKILGDEWIVPSLAESEYLGLISPEEPISPVESISAEDFTSPEGFTPPEAFIFPEEPISPEYPIPPDGFAPPEDPISPEDPIPPEFRRPPRDFNPPRDPLTGNPPVNGTPSTVTRLSNPQFRILIDTTRPNEYKVEGTVTVEISQDELPIFALFPMRLQSTLWGEDSGWNNDDNLFSFPAQRITAPGIYNFSAFVHRGTLNEDNTIFDRRDEVYNKFSIVSGNSFLPSPNIHIQSRTEHGNFG